MMVNEIIDREFGNQRTQLDGSRFSRLDPLLLCFKFWEKAGAWVWAFWGGGRRHTLPTGLHGSRGLAH